MVVEAWLARAAARAPRRASRSRRPRSALTYARAARRRRRAARGELAARGVAAGRARRDRAARRACDFVVALHACLLLGAVAVPGRPAARRARARARRGAARAVVVDEPLAGATAARRAASARHDLDASRSSSTPPARPRAPQAGRADLRQLAVERARLGRRARRSTRDERWLCALPLVARRRAVDPRCARDLRHDRGRARALRRPTASLHALRERRRHARLARRRRRSRGCSTPGCARPPRAALRAARRRPVPARAARARAPRPACPVAPTYGLTEACSQVTSPTLGRRRDRRAAAVLHARRARRPTARSSSPARPSRPARAPDGWLRTGDLGAPRRARAACASSAARPTRSSPAARTSRRPRSRRCSRPTRGRRGGRRRAARPGVGRGGRRASSCCAPARRADADELRAHCAARAGPLQGAQGDRAAPTRCRARARASCCAGSCG